jgi:hypothetical protein
VLLASALVLGATPNFSGTWVRDKDKSDPMFRGGGFGGGRGGPRGPAEPGAPGGPGGAEGSGRRGGGGPGGRPRGDAVVTLLVKQADNALAVTRKVSFGVQEVTTASTAPREIPPVEMKYTLDGKENSNPFRMGRFGESTMKSRSKWNKNKLVIEGSAAISTPNGEFDLGRKEEWELSADGKVLTITVTDSNPMGDRTSKQVYNKQ